MLADGAADVVTGPVGVGEKVVGLSVAFDANEAGTQNDPTTPVSTETSVGDSPESTTMS